MSESPQASAAYRDLLERLAPIEELGSIASLLQWDQQVTMPPGGAEGRGAQLATLHGIIHARVTDPELDRMVRRLEADGPALASDEAATLREARRGIDQATRVPAELVEELSRATSRARHVWVEARRNDDFAQFAPELERVLELRRREADALGWQEHPYDALHDQYEPGSTTARVERVFTPLRERLTALLSEISQAREVLDDEPLRRHFDPVLQERFVRQVAADLGYDFERGRLDAAVHPFAQAIGLGDVRITTRYDERFLSMALFGAIHETGHALYEQGIRDEDRGTPLGHPVSLAVHESQSRLWENLVGRGRPFWEGRYAALQATFPEALGDVPLDTFLRAVNRVAPSLIRVEADEVTYDLHVLLRFELEKALVEGSLRVRDLPEAWNEKCRAYLGITPPDHATGCLQDIHWSIGHVGYFPTYTLGNMTGVQLWNAAHAALPDLDDHLRAGSFAPLLGWLRENVHVLGSRLLPDDLLRRVTGAPLDAEPYLTYLEDKYARLYGLERVAT